MGTTPSVHHVAARRTGGRRSRPARTSGPRCANRGPRRSDPSCALGAEEGAEGRGDARDQLGREGVADAAADAGDADHEVGREGRTGIGKDTRGGWCKRQVLPKARTKWLNGSGRRAPPDARRAPPGGVRLARRRYIPGRRPPHPFLPGRPRHERQGPRRPRLRHPGHPRRRDARARHRGDHDARSSRPRPTCSPPSASRWAHYDYGRTANPTREALEANLAALESGSARDRLRLGARRHRGDREAALGRRPRGQRGEHLRRHDPDVQPRARADSASSSPTWTRATSTPSRRPCARTPSCVHVETPTNPMMRVCDIARPGRARARGRRAPLGRQHLRVALQPAAAGAGGGLHGALVHEVRERPLRRHRGDRGRARRGAGRGARLPPEVDGRRSRAQWTAG